MKGIKKGLAILLVLCTLLSMVVMTGAGTAESAEPQALTMGDKPADGTTADAPFPQGTGGSNSFRIPALVTLSNGNLVAAADARWNTTFDGGGLDTIVARSINNGETWNYTFANYLGDNGNAYNGSQSTAFIDPALAVASDDTIYMLCDLYPYGVALNGEGKTVPSTAVGFDDAGRLLLSADNGTSYNYYLDNGSIYSSDGSEVSGYTVDAYFNITGEDGCDTNLFFSDSPYKVVRTGYLYLTTSNDGGASWSVPTLIPNVKTTSERVCLVGPGRGLVTADGTIVFPVYSYNNNGSTTTQYTSFISSSDGGQTWTRSASFTGDSWSSESAVVELEDGTLRFFYRNGNSVLKYVDYADGVWGDSVNTGIKTNSNTQISAITYSKTVGGKQVILVSCPTGSGNNGSNDSSASARLNGQIQVGLVNADKTMTWKDPVVVTSNNAPFMYSCLTELQNGSVAILYENYESGWGLNSYYTMDYATYSASDLGLDAASDSDETFTSTENVTITVGGSTTITDSTGNYQDSYIGSGLNNNIATVQVAGTTTEESTTTEFSMVTSPVNGGSYYISDGNGNYLTLKSSTSWLGGTSYSLTNATDPSSATRWTVTKNTNGTWKIYSNGQYISYSQYYGLSVTDNSSGSVNWYYSETAGIYGASSGSLGFNFNGSSWTTSSGYGNGAFYANQTVTIPAVDKTDIAITGVAVGTTSVVVGNTKYNITVQEAPDYLDISTSPFLGGTGDSTNGSNGRVVTKLTTAVGESYDLNIDSTKAASGGTWSIGDESIATITSDGTITAIAEGTTTATYTVNGVSYTIPVVVVQSYATATTGIMDLYITEISDTSVKYSFNVSQELLDCQEGEVIYLHFSPNFCINFFGVEDEGYALTYMASTNSAGNYYSLYETTNVTQLNAYNSGAMYYQRDEVSSWTQPVQELLRYVVDSGYHGTMGWTRTKTNTSNIYSNLTFRSEKLPTVEKTIKTVGGEPYTEGMTAKRGDVIVYDVTVTQYKTTEAITYSNVNLTDNLSGAKFSTNNSSTVSPSLSNSTLTANKTYTYEVTYTIQDSDLDTDIINTVDLSYSYSGQYSEGNYGGSAKAEAKISAPTFAPYDIVIDFGLPVTIDYSTRHGRYNIESGTATYGNVTVEDNVVTYTPNTVLKGMDTVTLTNIKGVEYTFNVYPATTVYYEEGFATPYAGKDISTGSKGTGTQAAEAVGDKQNVYGYDPAYEDIIPSALTDGTIELNAAGEGVSFEFTGTGVDIYTNSNTDTGTVMVYVYKGTGNTKQFKELISVDTAMRNGNTGATMGQAVTAYNVPIVSLSGLPYGDYTVEVDVVNSKVTSDDGTTTKQILPVYIDGFRVYGTLEDQDNAVYTADQEDSPVFVELRDRVLASLNAKASNSEQYADQIAKNTLSQVYATAGTTEGVAITSKPGTYTDATLTDLLDKGPKNEIYLQPNQALTFKITTNRVVQIGLKALNAATTYTITGKDGDQSLSASTDMFYEVLKKAENASEQTITITNKGAGILAITKLKVCDDPNATLGELTAEDLIPALVSLGFEAEPVPATATLNITVQCGDKAIPVTLTAEGMSNETHTFTAAEIKAAVEQALPEGYTLDGVTFEDVTVTCGEASDVSFTAAEIPAPTPVSPLQKIVQIAVKIIKKIVSWF